jgi:putative transposase
MVPAGSASGADEPPDTTEISITRTVRLKLETSQTKNELVRAGITAYQSVLEHMATHLPSYPEREWEPYHGQMYRQAQRGLPDDEHSYKTTLAQEAQQQVAESYKSWRERGKPGDSPKRGFGNGSYLGLRGDDIEIEKNERGWGLKARFISYNPVWFHIDSGEFQRKFLERITNPEDATSSGAGELHLDDGTLYCHLAVSWPVETWTAEDVETTVGVDLNDNPLVAVAAWDGGEVVDVHLESGAEFRHHRERMKRARDQAMADDNLKAITEARRNYRRYTDHITNVASRRVVDVAEKHEPCRVHLEDLTHLRETVDDPIHDWPYAQIQDQIVAKAREAGIPVKKIDPRDTSRECRRCGKVSNRSRDGRTFVCVDCGYEVHADVNAAINIAQQP